MLAQSWKLLAICSVLHQLSQLYSARANCLLPDEDELLPFIEVNYPDGENVTVDSVMVNCLAAGVMFDTYRLATFTALFETSESPGVQVMAYVDISCVEGVWQLGHFQPGAGATTNRTDCALCISPESPLAEFFMGIDTVHHCIACDEACLGVGFSMCLGEGSDQCCSYYDNGTCVADCGSNQEPDTDFDCVCANHWQGERCLECGLSCHNDGAPSDDCSLCVCGPLFTGLRCETRISNPCESDPCLNGAVCNLTTSGFECFCQAGFKGVHCETSSVGCHDDFCHNGGTCLEGDSQATCKCPPGFTGVTCDTEINHCADLPCQNGGVCEEGICLCPFGYTSSLCEVNIDDCFDGPCLNNGVCTDEVGDFTCVCPGGFTGKTCEVDIDECAELPCQNGGSCKDGMGSFICTCKLGYEGSRCEIDIDDCAHQPCLNDGKCTDLEDGFVCMCSVGFTGTYCETNVDDCVGSPCENGGSCLDGVNRFSCSCPAGFTGDMCQIVINYCADVPCENGGHCAAIAGRGVCVCPPGYTGEFCQTDVDDCESQLCQNNGHCVDLINDYSCKCQMGFSGRNCDTNIDDCSSDPCLNGGSCVDGIDNYICLCSTLHSGKNCQKCASGFVKLSSGECVNDCSKPCKRKDGKFERDLCEFYCQLEFWRAQAASSGLNLPEIVQQDGGLPPEERWRMAVSERDRLAEIWRTLASTQGVVLETEQQNMEAQGSNEALLEHWNAMTMRTVNEHSLWQEYAQNLKADFPIQTQEDGDSYDTLMLKWSTDMSNYVTNFTPSCHS